MVQVCISNLVVTFHSILSWVLVEVAIKGLNCYIYGVSSLLLRIGSYIWWIMGDSKTIVEWACNQRPFQSISLHHWSLQVWKLIDDSLTLSIIHVYRELNTQADLLSKQAMGMDPDFIHWKEYNKDLLIQEGAMPCY